MYVELDDGSSEIAAVEGEVELFNCRISDFPDGLSDPTANYSHRNLSIDTSR